MAALPRGKFFFRPSLVSLNQWHFLGLNLGLEVSKEHIHVRIMSFLIKYSFSIYACSQVYCWRLGFLCSVHNFVLQLKSEVSHFGTCVWRASGITPRCSRHVCDTVALSFISSRLYSMRRESRPCLPFNISQEWLQIGQLGIKMTF